MPRVLLLLFTSLLAACAVKPEFKRVQPDEVAVVIGYEFAGSKSVNPKVATAAYVAGLFTGGVPGLVLMTGSLTINSILRTDDAITMVDEFNEAVYRDIEETLTAKGYKVSLFRKVPLSFKVLRSDKLADTYVPYILENYQLSETELQASGADAVLYVQYRIDANITDMEKLQSMNVQDLTVNRVKRQTLAVSLPPANKLLFHSPFQYEPLLNRLSFEESVEYVTDLHNWPDQTSGRR